jgi:hypothetical protein
MPFKVCSKNPSFYFDCCWYRRSVETVVAAEEQQLDAQVAHEEAALAQLQATMAHLQV